MLGCSVWTAEWAHQGVLGVHRWKLKFILSLKINQLCKLKCSRNRLSEHHNGGYNGTSLFFCYH